MELSNWEIRGGTLQPFDDPAEPISDGHNGSAVFRSNREPTQQLLY